MPTIDKDTGEVNPARPFHETLTELSEGATDTELGETLHRLIEAVQDTGKAGTLTLTLAVGFDGAGRVVVKDNVSVKLPEHNRPTTSFFIDKKGNPSRRDPNQPELPTAITQITTNRKDA